MMKHRIIATVAVLLAFCAGARSQNVIDLIVSEVMAESDSLSLVDDYGRRNGWIEIFNTSQGTVNLGGCYLTDDRDNLKKSLIQKGDLRTQLGPRQSIVFFASGDSSDGTFYTNFTIRPGSTIYLVSNDGRTIVDSIEVPQDLPAGMSVTKIAEDLKQMDFRTVPQPAKPTPYSSAGAHSAESKAQKIAESDPHGWTLTVTSVSVVFCALAILWFLFWILFERPAKQKAKAKDKPAAQKKAAAKGGKEDEIAAAVALALDMDGNGETYAAIAMALHLHLTDCVHDTEPYFITIKRSSSSDWNDKTQNFRKHPTR